MFSEYTELLCYFLSNDYYEQNWERHYLMKVLWISPYAPYDTVGHGGGQNHNHCIKYVRENTDFDITLLSVCKKEEQEKLDLKEYEIDNIVNVYNKNLYSKIDNAFGKVFIKRDGGLLSNRTYHLLLDAIKEYAKRGIKPDIIITQWTEATLMYEKIKQFFPDSKYIAIEEDVAFLGFQRKYEKASGFRKTVMKNRYEILKNAEIKTLQKYDTVVVLNEKDKNLLVKENIPEEKIVTMCAYHGLSKPLNYQPDIHKILFYGAMNRKENYSSVVWFIENVMDKLDKSYQLIIAGSNPPTELMKYESDRIVITGFVEDITPYFESCLCLVSPLLLGAGIKIKILEALSAGLPVITNAIGAEGINLTDGENYLHCEKPDEYISAVYKLSNDEELRNRLSKNGIIHIANYFDTDASLDKIIGKMRDLCS